MIDFHVRVLDDGRVMIHKYAVSAITTQVNGLDMTFEPALLEPEDWIALHVDTATQGMGPSGKGVKRLVRIGVYDDSVPSFSSPEEADLWMEARRRG